MATRLDVGNLPNDAQPDELRRRFAAFGDVVEVRVVHGGHAFVTMATLEDARAAASAMDGAELHERRLRVSTAREQPTSDEPRAAPYRRLRITKTYRERTNVTYEID